MVESDHQQLFEFINSYSLFYNKYDIDINVIHLITHYTKGIILSWQNKVIFYPTKFDFRKDPNSSNYYGKIAINGKYQFNFQDMGLSEDLLRGIHDYGWDKPTEIQQLAIMPIIDKQNVIIQSQSGTGKTGVFSIAALQRVCIGYPWCQILILSPNRELSIQTSKVITKLARYIKHLTIGLCVDDEQDISLLKEAQIILSTPQKN